MKAQTEISFKNNIINLYGVDIESAKRAEKELNSFKESEFIQYITFCAQILKDSNESEGTLLKFVALAIKNFFETRENRTIEEIKAQWFASEGESKEIASVNIREIIITAIYAKINCNIGTIRKICAKVLSSICLIDDRMADKIINDVLSNASSNSSLQNIDALVNFFNELFLNGYYDNNSLMMPEYLPIVVQNTLQFLQASLGQNTVDIIEFQKTVISFLSWVVKVKPALVDNQDAMGIIFQATDGIIHCGSTDANLYNSVSDLFLSLIKVFYPMDTIGVIWESIVEKLIPIISESGVPYMIVISMLFLLHKVADFEHKLLKTGQECKLLIQGIAPTIVTPLLNTLIIPLEEGEEFDSDIEVASQDDPYYFASCALNEITRISQNEVAETIFGFVRTFLLDDSAPPNFVNAAILALSALTYGPMNEGYSDNIYSFINERVLFKFAVSDNDRIKENAIYCIYRIIKKYDLRCADDCIQLLEIVEANVESCIEIRKRCGDMIKTMCGSISQDFINTNFDQLLDLTKRLSENPQNPDENIITPIIGMYTAIDKASEEENVERFMDLLHTLVDSIKGCPDVFNKKRSVILIAALCKNLKSNIGENADEVLSSIVDNLGEFDSEFYQDAITSISYLIEFNPVSPDFYPKMLKLFDDVKEGGVIEATVAVLRLLGKYITRTNPPIADDSLDALNKAFEMLKEYPAVPNIFLNVLQFMAEICVLLKAPSKDTIQTIWNILSYIMSKIDNFDVENAPRISIYVIMIYSKLLEKVGRRNASFFLEIYREILEFTRSIYNKFDWDTITEENNFVSNQFLMNTSILMIMIMKALGKRCNMFINKSKFIEMLKRGMENDNEQIRNTANAAFTLIRNG